MRVVDETLTELFQVFFLWTFLGFLQLDVLSGAVARRYELWVDSGATRYQLRLIDPTDELPELALNHLGQWMASGAVSR